MLSKISRSAAARTRKAVMTSSTRQFAISPKSQYYMDMERQYVATYYKHLPVVIERGQGSLLYDVDGNEYLDFINGFSSVSQGHCHPKIQAAIIEQVGKVTQFTRALYGVELSLFAKYLCDLLGFQKFLPSSSGVEACESACKVARRWGYEVKGVEQDRANILMANGCFWGRSITACSGSSDPRRSRNFGPLTPGFPLVPYNDLQAIENYLKSDSNCVAVFLEPVQGEGGVIVPDDGYMRGVRKLCDKYNVLMICDEIQTGLGRSGKLMCYEYDDIKPDICTLGKALSGGVTPVSGIVGTDETLGLLGFGDHGSTFGGNPLGMAVAHTAVKIIVEEGLAENAYNMGKLFRKNIRDLNSPVVKEVRGKGLLSAIETRGDLPEPYDAATLSDLLLDNGVIARASAPTIMRIQPALVITKDQVNEASERFAKSIRQLESMCK